MLQTCVKNRLIRRGIVALALLAVLPGPPLDFAPTALQPLIRRNGVLDCRRWESALFLKVRDEIQTGNLAIDGAKNFGRFEAFFLPSAQWEQVHEAFWARTRFPVDPDAAVEQLKTRLSDPKPRTPRKQTDPRGCGDRGRQRLVGHHSVLRDVHRHTPLCRRLQ